MGKTAIGIDLGGTRIKAVAIDTEGNLLDQLYQPTNDGDDMVWKNSVAQAVNDLKKKINKQDIVIGISAPDYQMKKIQLLLLCREGYKGWKILTGQIFCSNKHGY